MVQPQLSLLYETSPALPDDEATAPPLRGDLISWSAWGPLAVYLTQASHGVWDGASLPQSDAQGAAAGKALSSAEKC